MADELTQRLFAGVADEIERLADEWLPRLRAAAAQMAPADTEAADEPDAAGPKCQMLDDWTRLICGFPAVAVITSPTSIGYGCKTCAPRAEQAGCVVRALPTGGGDFVGDAVVRHEAKLRRAIAIDLRNGTLIDFLAETMPVGVKPAACRAAADRLLGYLADEIAGESPSIGVRPRTARW